MTLRIQRKIKLAISSPLGTELSSIVELPKIVEFVELSSELNSSVWVEFNEIKCAKP